MILVDFLIGLGFGYGVIQTWKVLVSENWGKLNFNLIFLNQNKERNNQYENLLILKCSWK